VLLMVDEEPVEEDEEEEMLNGVDIIDTGVDSAVVDNVDEVDGVDTGVDVLDMELVGDVTKVDIVDIRGVGDSTVDIGVLLCSVVAASVVVSTLVGGTELNPAVVEGVVEGAVVEGVVEGAVVDGVVGGVVDGGTPQMQMPHSALVVGRVEPVVEVERRGVVEVDPSRWGVWGIVVVLVLDPAVKVEEPLVEGEVDVDERVGVDAVVDEDTKDEVVGVEDDVGDEDEAVVEPVSK